MSAMKELVESICAMYDEGVSPKAISAMLDMSKAEVEEALSLYHNPEVEVISTTTH
jgi:chromosome segregation and condensation protein ScpB